MTRFRRILRNMLGALFGFFVIVYVAQLLINRGNELPAENPDANASRHEKIAIFGATGTAGDGLLKAAMSDPDVKIIHVITRRLSPRIEAGIASGAVKATIHTDYLDYSGIIDVLGEVDTVYWAIGLSALGLDEETYRRIHREFPSQLITEWMNGGSQRDRSFHYISGNGANDDSRMMWAREKARAEIALFDQANGSTLRVIAYRPNYIAPTKEQSNFGNNLLYAFLAPINSAVRATAIGQAMLEVSARGSQIKNGTILTNKDIIAYSNAYQSRK